jgi:hypothetical protein
MTLRWYTLVIDCHDIGAQARWWAETLDWVIDYEDDQEVAVVPRHARRGPVAAQDWLTEPPGLVFVPVAEGKTVKNRLHIDLAPHSAQHRGTEIEALLTRGATRVDIGQSTEVTWTVLADPEGNEFCVLSSREE